MTIYGDTCGEANWTLNAVCARPNAWMKDCAETPVICPTEQHYKSKSKLQHCMHNIYITSQLIFLSPEFLKQTFLQNIHENNFSNKIIDKQNVFKTA